ncbi:hypothetical protein HKX48_000524 [Thoreauomyces humboldtii]|nr:hypothetical protein HKX48_000524 [Thoreauomyces humboldtii]
MSSSTTTTSPSDTPVPYGSRGTILVVLSGSDHITLANGAEQPTGYFLPELAKPLARLLDAGYAPVFANPTGVKPAEDPMSSWLVIFLGNWFERRRENALLENMRKTAGLDQPRRLGDIKDEELDAFKGVFIPGGHAPMEDLWQDKDLGRILMHFHERSKPTASLCHGPIALLSTRTQSSTFPYAGYLVSVYSDREESMNEVAFGSALKFHAEAELEKAGCKINNSPIPMAVHVSTDRELVTGQGFSSAAGLGDAFVALLEKSGSATGGSIAGVLEKAVAV